MWSPPLTCFNYLPFSSHTRTQDDVTYLGPKDFHDPAYGKYEVTRNIADYLAERADPTTRSLTAVNMNSQGQYQVSFYISHVVRTKNNAKEKNRN